jgi:hypothetical protein
MDEGKGKGKSKTERVHNKTKGVQQTKSPPQTDEEKRKTTREETKRIKVKNFFASMVEVEVDSHSLRPSSLF